MADTVPSQQPSPAPPWPQCGRGAEARDGVGCRGRRVEPFPACLAHLPTESRVAYLNSLRPGSDIDHRGTRFTTELLAEVLAALEEPATNRPHIGTVRFDEAEIRGDARFDGVQISGSAQFPGIKISGTALFNGTVISGDARFVGAEIGGSVQFPGVEIGGSAQFDEVRIGGSAHFPGVKIGRDVLFDVVKVSGDVWFGLAKVGGTVLFTGVKIGGIVQFVGAEICDTALFEGAEISGDARLDNAQIRGDVRFDNAEIKGNAQFLGVAVRGNASFVAAKLGGVLELVPIKCGGSLVLSRAVFEAAVTVEAAARRLECLRTRWKSTAVLRLRYAEIDLRDAVLESLLSIAARSQPFTLPMGAQMNETGLGDDPSVRVVSLQGMDAAHLLLSDIDLTRCRFLETIHLDQLRLEGQYQLPVTPTGVHWRRWRPLWWSRRRTIAEEQSWRADGYPGQGWTVAPQTETDAAQAEAPEPGPASLAPTYRKLRKALEDGRDEPGAADFYYGEMEMRRHHMRDVPRFEWALLTAYWALSGYGLRAARALGWLV